MDFSLITELAGTVPAEVTLFAGIVLGLATVLFALVRTTRERAVAAQRMGPAKPSQLRRASLAAHDEDPVGLSALLVPHNHKERFEVAQALSRAGFRSRHAVVAYYGIRLALGFGLPLAFLGLIAAARFPQSPVWIIEHFSQWSTLSILQAIGALTGVGFFTPAWWLRNKISSRKRAIEEAFPNMLDLLQVGVEAGMGFDQAMLKVATEIHAAAPELAEEMLVALSEMRAGRDRDSALMQMAKRTGVDEVSSFVNVVLQSSRFGSPLSDALTTYAGEMRLTRELRAQEKANKLPVQMSAVMASLMLPSLIALIMAPIIIRYMNQFGG
jgi:tight adherence protein C